MSTPINIDAIHDLILLELRIGMQRESEALNVSYDSVRHIIDVVLNIKTISA